MWGAVAGSGVRTDDETLPEGLRMGREKRGRERKPGAAPMRAEQAPHCLCFIRSFGAHAAAP